MQIFTKTISGKSVTLNVRKTDRVESVKLRIQEKEGTEVSLQRLFLGGKNLENDKTLFDYNVQSESTLHLTMSLRGGGSTQFMSFCNPLWGIFAAFIIMILAEGSKSTFIDHYYSTSMVSCRSLVSQETVVFLTEVGQTDVKVPVVMLAGVCIIAHVFFNIKKL